MGGCDETHDRDACADRMQRGTAPSAISLSYVCVATWRQLLLVSTRCTNPLGVDLLPRIIQGLVFSVTDCDDGLENMYHPMYVLRTYS